MSIFGASLFLMYMLSTLYHALTPYGARKVFSILSHCSIYILIASTYTPFALLTVGGASGWVLFGLSWGAALIFCTLYAVFGARIRMFSVLTYMIMGWLFLAVVSLCKMNLSNATMAFIISGGISYSVGCIFYLLRKYKWTHSIFHVFVLAGSILHFFAVFSII